MELSRQKLREILETVDPDHTYVAWTGGKDSTLVLYLWRELLRSAGYSGRVRALNVDTGFKFPEIIKFRDETALRWEIDLSIARPNHDPASYPVAKDKLQCCTDLKISPLKKTLKELGIRCLITGIRADEHSSRGKRACSELDDTGCLRLNPLLHWAEMDVWSFIWQKGLDYCPLYEQGYRSLGCMPCTNKTDDPGERSGRDNCKEKKMDVLRSLGYF